MATKRLITTEEHEFRQRTLTYNKIVIEFKNFIISGQTGFGVETAAYRLLNLEPGQIDYGILSRLELIDNKTIPYPDNVINGLFVAVNKSIDYTRFFS